MGGPIQTSPVTTGAQRRRGTTNAAGPALLMTRSINGRRAFHADLYHWLLNVPWPVFIGIIVGGYMLANLVFATIYTLIPDSVAGSSGFVDNFFFSVQTWATIGYGGMTPRGNLANSVVVLESMTGIFGVALLTGLFFAKFSRPDARILFADRVVISMYGGKPTLMLRLANERGSNIVEAQAHMMVIREERTAEGHTMRRIHDVKLVRDTQPLFRLSWTLMHVVDESSPLWGFDAQAPQWKELRLFVNIMGFDASVGQTCHSSAGYGVEDVHVGARYVDASRVEGGSMILDFAKFHDVEAAELPSGALQEKQKEKEKEPSTPAAPSSSAPPTASA